MVKLKKKSLSRGGFGTHGRVIGNKNFFWGLNLKPVQWPSGRASNSRARGWAFDPHLGRCVVSFSKTHLPPKSTGQEAVAPSRHD